MSSRSFGNRPLIIYFSVLNAALAVSDVCYKSELLLPRTTILLSSAWPKALLYHFKTNILFVHTKASTFYLYLTLYFHVFVLLWIMLYECQTSRQEADPPWCLWGVSQRTIIGDYGTVRSGKIDTAQRPHWLSVSVRLLLTNPQMGPRGGWWLLLLNHRLIVSCFGACLVHFQEQWCRGNDSHREPRRTEGQQESVQLHSAGRQPVPLVHSAGGDDAGRPVKDWQQIEHISTVYGECRGLKLL